MAGNFESLNFEITVNAASAIEQVTQLASSLDTLKRALKGLDSDKAGKAVSSVAESAKKAVENSKGVAEAFNSFSGHEIDVKGLADSTLSLADAMQMVRNAMGSVGENWASTAKNIGGSVIDVEGATDSVERMSSALSKIDDESDGISTAVEQVKGLGEQFRDFESSAMNTSDVMNEAMSVASSSVGILTTAINVATKAATFLVDQFNDFLATMKKFKKVAEGFNEKFNPFVSLKRELTSLISLAKRQILRRAINAVIKAVTEGLREGVANLAQYDERFSATIQSFKNAMGLFKNSIGVAVAPIISYFIPAINAMLSALTRAMNMLARLTALLTGQHTYTIAKDYQDIGDSAGGASSKVKELERTILGFDEINKLNRPSGSSGGGGGGAGDAISAYETLDVGEWPYKSWGEALLAFVNWLDQTGVPKLRAGLDKVSKGVNEFSRNLYDALTFEGVQDAIGNLGRHLGETINNFLNGGERNGGLNWADMGKALGMSIQTAFHFAAEFLLQLDFLELGQNLGTFINNAVQQINPKDIADVLFTPIRAAFGLVVGFLTTFDFPEFAQKAGEVVNHMVESLAKLIGGGTGEKHGGKWESYLQIAANNIANGLVRFFDTVDWVALFNTLRNVVGSIISALELILKRLMADKNFMNALHGFIDFIVETAVKWFMLKLRAVLSAGKGFSWRSVFGAIDSSMDTPFSEWSLSDFSLSNFIGSITDASDAVEDFGDTSTAVTRVTKDNMRAVETSGEQMAQHVDISGRYAVNAFRTMTTNSSKPLSDLASSVSINFSNAKNSINNNLSAASTNANNYFANIRDNAKNRTAEAKNYANSEAQALQNYLNTRFRDAASTANTQFASMRDNIKSRVAEAKNGIPSFNDVGKNIKDGVISGMGDFKGKLNEWCNQFKDQILKNFKIKSPSRWASEMVGTNITEGIALGMEGSSSVVEEACAGLKEGIVGEFNGMSIMGSIRRPNADVTSAIGNSLTGALASMEMNREQPPVQVDVYLDRDKIATAVTRGQMANNRRYSTTAMA